MTMEEEQKLKKKVLKGNWGIAKDKASIHASMEKARAPLAAVHARSRARVRLTD